MKPMRKRRVQYDQTKRLMRALREAVDSTANTADPIVEQLKKCPEAFKVGEILGKALDTLKYTQEGIGGDRLFPPPATVFPPFA
jgi:hypothetical protein